MIFRDDKLLKSIHSDILKACVRNQARKKKKTPEHPHPSLKLASNPVCQAVISKSRVTPQIVSEILHLSGLPLPELKKNLQQVKIYAKRC